MIPSFKLPIVLFATAALLALTACENGDYYPDASSAVSGGVTVDVGGYMQMAPSAPPAPQFEEKPYINDPRHTVWQPGYWDYSRGSYSWVSGKLVDKPTFTAVWSPDHWIRHTYGWAFVPGYWQ